MKESRPPFLLRALVISWALVSAGLAGCLADDKLASERQNFTSDAPATRANPMDPLARACGPELPPSPHLTRRPYLAAQDETTMKVLWTAPEGGGQVTLRLTRPGTDELETARAARDPSARPVYGSPLYGATVSNLAPDALYCYELHLDGTPIARAGFRTPPLPDREEPVRFVAFGDSGDGGNSQAAVLAQMHTVPFDFMIHVGDIAYDTGTRVEFEKNFFDVYADLLARFPMFPASGNHEYETEAAAPFREVFALPENGGPEGRERWYSFDWGPVHFVVLDTELQGPTQAAWLDADLAAAKRPWTIVYGHRPPFSSAKRGGDEKFRTHFVPVLEKHRVPLVLSGHEHHYERIQTKNGVNYVVTGGGGRHLRGIQPRADAAYAESVLHFVSASVTPHRLELHAIDASGREFDALVLSREATASMLQGSRPCSFGSSRHSLGQRSNPTSDGSSRFWR
ncbi:MAG: metallophosphoesterase [Myxococcales bacterium]|nr:metallophosphoesterase [Myxococcales bacterium]